jgi:hypothetical protein
MKKSIVLSVFLFAQLASAQDLSPQNLLSICQGKSNPSQAPSSTSLKLVNVENKDLMIIDKGFCQEYLKQQSEIKVSQVAETLEKGIGQTDLNSCPPEKKIGPESDKWKVRFYASHSFTTYFNSDINFQSSRYNVEIKDYEWAERGSREFFTLEEWKKPGSNPFQMIDEPTNTFTVSLEKDGHEFFLSAFHPKFLQANDQVKHIKGTIDGVAVDEVAPINKPFDGYNQSPGESELVRNQNTHKQMTFELGYGHRFTLLDSKIGSLNYVPSIGLGVMVGENVTVMVKEGQWWDFDEYQDKHGIQGFGGSITNRLEFNTPKERFGVFYENKIGYYHQKHGFLDGTQEYNLGFMGNSVGMKFMINNPNNKKKSGPTL